MGKLTNEQKDFLRDYLKSEGLAFKPLLDEMVDHIACDLEGRMSEGLSFQEAWDQSIPHIPDNHFQIIQKEIMETINKRITLSQILSFFALGLVFISAVFKMLHLAGAGASLLLSFAFMGGSLLSASLSGIFLNKRKKGAARVLGVIIGIILLITGFSFKFLHMPGGDEIIGLGVAGLAISLVVNSLYIYKHASGEGNLLTYLHERYTPAIERFLLILLIPLVIYKVLSIFLETSDFFGNVFLLVVIVGAGLQLILLIWRALERNLDKRNALTLAATIICCLCLVLPFLGPVLPLPLRIVLVTMFSPIAGWLAYTTEDEPKKAISLLFVGLISIAFLVWGIIQLNGLSSATSRIVFNIPVLLILVAGVFITRKHGPMRAFMLVSLAGYLFEYVL